MTPQQKAFQLIEIFKKRDLVLSCIEQIIKSRSSDDSSYCDDENIWHDWDSFWDETIIIVIKLPSKYD